MDASLALPTETTYEYIWLTAISKWIWQNGTSLVAHCTSHKACMLEPYFMFELRQWHSHVIRKQLCESIWSLLHTQSHTHTCYALSWSHDNFILFLYLFSVLLFSPLVYRGTHTHTRPTSSHIIYLPHLFCLCRIVDVSVEKLLLYC